MIFVFEIFEIAHDRRKLALYGHPLGIPRGAHGCPGMPSVGQLGEKKILQPHDIQIPLKIQLF